MVGFYQMLKEEVQILKSIDPTVKSNFQGIIKYMSIISQAKDQLMVLSKF